MCQMNVAETPVKQKRVKVKHPAGYRRPDTSTILPFGEYDLIIVAFSGGKDSLACLLSVCEECDKHGVPRSKVEAWHQCVDGKPGSENNWDWPVTDAYCQAVCRALGVTYRRQWREGGLSGELMKKDERTKGITFELPDGTTETVGGTQGAIGTRGRHPAQSADMFARWCSPISKIDPCSSAIRNDPRLKGAKVLVITGERRQESSNRAAYATIEKRAGTTVGSSKQKARRVDQYRIILEWTEQQVWDKIRQYRIQVHPAYRIGFGRCSCLTCIFNQYDEWATVRKIAPKPFGWHAGVEQSSGHTIRRGLTVIDQADRGTPLPGAEDAELVALAMGTEYPDCAVFVPDGAEWTMPAGAFRSCGGPT